MYICPSPQLWNAIFLALENEWKINGGVDVPPVPLILAGWVFTSDDEKHQRWTELLEWAKRRELMHLIPNIPDSDWYHGEMHN